MQFVCHTRSTASHLLCSVVGIEPKSALGLRVSSAASCMMLLMAGMGPGRDSIRLAILCSHPEEAGLTWASNGCETWKPKCTGLLFASDRKKSYSI
jgi:hypothetical protein